MRKTSVALLSMVLILMLSLGNFAFAANVNDSGKDIEHIIFVDNELLPAQEEVITPFGFEFEKEFKDGLIVSAPKGSTSKTFSVESGDTRLNVWFDNKSNVSVNMTLMKKSGLFGSWTSVDSVSIDAGKNKTITVINPDPDVTYKVEVANTSGDKIIGTLRIRSFVY